MGRGEGRIGIQPLDFVIGTISFFARRHCGGFSAFSSVVKEGVVVVVVVVVWGLCKGDGGPNRGR